MEMRNGNKVYPGETFLLGLLNGKLVISWEKTLQPAELKVTTGHIFEHGSSAAGRP
jgi:hypothetical protein